MKRNTVVILFICLIAAFSIRPGGLPEEQRAAAF